MTPLGRLRVKYIAKFFPSGVLCRIKVSNSTMNFNDSIPKEKAD